MSEEKRSKYIIEEFSRKHWWLRRRWRKVNDLLLKENEVTEIFISYARSHLWQGIKLRITRLEREGYRRIVSF
jgi:hypothetical protein